MQDNYFKNIIFYIDLLSIARGLYNKNTLLFEIDSYFESRQPPKFFIDELKLFLNNLWMNFRNYNPFFIIFFDQGYCKQNNDLLNTYKERRNYNQYIDIGDDEKDLLKKIKEHYLSEIEKNFTKQNISVVINLNEYESDFIPYFVLQNNLLNSNDKSTLNVILSLDKDLLQCCEFENVIQYVTLFNKKELVFTVYHNENAISYFYKNFKRGLLSAKYIPLLLAIAGDKADNIEGIKNIGYSKAYNLIIQYKLEPDINLSTKLPKELEPYRQQIINNYQLISFKSQITRIPILIKNKIKEKINESKHQSAT